MVDIKQQQDITFAEINLAALQHNLDTLLSHTPNSKLIAVIKANAYGHGILAIAQSLQSSGKVYALGVARLSEALRLRHAGIELPIILLEGVFNEQDLPLLAQYNLQSVVHSQEQLQSVISCHLTEQLTLWLKLDTGMHRLGFHPQQFSQALQTLTAAKQVKQPVNVITHFHCSDEIDNPITTQQIELFNSLTTQKTGMRSLANSAAVLAWPDSHADLVRPGIALYGISPFSDKSAQEHNLKPVMTFKSQLIAVRDHDAGESVGYGAIWHANKATTLGVIAVGYGDGYPRMAPAGTPVLINGRIVPIVGRVSMDMITVDLGLTAQDKVGDQVTLWGEGLPIEHVAQHIGTIAYELTTKLTERVSLTYRD